MRYAPGKETVVLDGQLWWWCPGCEMHHGVPVDPADPKHWAWNGSLEAPTLSPSVRVYTHANSICHCFIREGKIEFLNDCLHALAGQTVAMVTPAEAVKP